MRKTLLDLHEILGEKILVRILNCKASELEKVMSSPNQVPSPMEDKINFIAALIRNLKGSYNHYGMRGWLERKRDQLNGKAPIELMSGDWWPRDPELLAVLMLSSPF